jgi:hypothetical protein
MAATSGFLSTLPSQLQATGSHLSALAVQHYSGFLPWFGLYLALHVLFEYAVPAVWPDAYAALGRKQAREGLPALLELSKQADQAVAAAGSGVSAAKAAALQASVQVHKAALAAARSANARTARTMLVASIMAIHVSILSLQGLFSHEFLRSSLYEETPLTHHLVRVAVGYFLWDVLICFTDGLGWEFRLHGLACIFVFGAALVSMLLCALTGPAPPACSLL